MSRPPTLREVAELAGVSIKTVSRVVNGEPSVTGPTAARVLDAVERLGYRPNPLARSLRTGTDAAVGVVVEAISDPFYSGVTEAIEEAARARGLFLIVASARTSEMEYAVVRGLLHRAVSGLVVVPGELDYGSRSLGLGPGGIPIVFVDRPPVGLDADTVLIENEQCAFDATMHLLTGGHRRVAFAALNLDTYTLRNRFEGYRRALAAAEVPYDDGLVISTPRRLDEFPATLSAALERPSGPTALLSANSITTVQVVTTLHRLGRTDVAFVGFDDFPTADALRPAVTVVRQDVQRIGQAAARLLFQRLDGDRSPTQRVAIPTELICRGSGELPPPDAVPPRRTASGARKPTGARSTERART